MVSEMSWPLRGLARISPPGQSVPESSRVGYGPARMGSSSCNEARAERPAAV